MRGLQGRGSQERPAGDRRLTPKQGVRCARAGIGVDGGTVDGDRRKPLEEIGPGGEKKEPTAGALGTQMGRTDCDRGGDGAQGPVLGIWKDFGAQTPRTALSWVDQAGPGHQTHQITHHFLGLKMPVAAESCPSENRRGKEINATPLWAA
ncbi:unnamed protein product [Rangifer tarandus platyrhynchus]|uniref:Uncharacterized protein n=2 Tax=Rangifer tarandus platyrhynchus TaxID=3082113 RepID=A0ACB0DU20_RANTA|nr:unnamed protein product [Rangifer tarandus platyrhynchus]CAI9691822.1 unnamed protein product [Rangifer tarandus platyrhynchus]